MFTFKVICLKFKLMKGFIYFTTTLFFITSCGGSGSKPLPTVNLTATPTSVVLGNTSTFSWTSTNANSCSASWTIQTSTFGTELLIINNLGNNTYSISCNGDGGISSASVTVEGYRETDGVVVDGYISGAEVCIDEDENWTCDSNENSTTSDNEGKFTIRYANGNLVSIGGTDLDSQTLLDNLLITHKLIGHSDFKAVTPVTSIAAFMDDASLVNTVLGIDSSIDVFTFDPVANKGDGGINDYLYEKGNQLTVLAFALQNITNNLNTTTETTQDYFKAITEEIEKEYTETETKVDIETEAFVIKVFDNVITAKSVIIDETAKVNTTKALASILPVIEVKSSDDLTTGVIRFTISTLQTDIQAIANGTATAETVTSYTSDVLAYIAEDQDIDADEIAPDISALADSASTNEDTAVEINLLLNDSYLTSAPISVTAGNGSNGTTSITTNIVIYDPDLDFNGTDTFSYTITQGDKTSSADVTMTIEAVNDAPSIDVASTIQVAENQTAVTTVSTSDVDEDDLNLTLSGTDADSFNLSDENVLTFKEAPDYETKDSYSITLTLTDGTETVTKDISIAITNVNDVAPEFISDTTFSAAENQTAIGTVTATDAEGDEVIFTVSGTELAITSSGVITFVSAPDYETKTSYTATVIASDGINNTTQDITVNVTNENDNSPSFTSEATFSAAENQTAIGTLTTADADGDTITYSISGSDITINPSSGVITFVSAPDYETKASYSATVTASDGVNSTTQDVSINTTNIDEGIISWDYDISDGTDNSPPILNSTIQFDASMDIDDAIVTLRQDVNTGFHAFKKIQHTKTSTNKWVGTFIFPENANPNLSYYGTIFYKEGGNSTNFNGLQSAAITGSSKWTEIITSHAALKLGLIDETNSFSSDREYYSNPKILKIFNNESFDNVAPAVQGYIDNQGNLISSPGDALIISGNDGDVATPINVSLTVQYDEDILYAMVWMNLRTDGGLYTEYRDVETTINGNKVTINLSLNSKAAIDGDRDLRLYIHGYDSGLNRTRTSTGYLDLESNSIGDANGPTLSSINFSASLRNNGRKLIDYKYVFSAEDNDLIEIGQTLKGPYCNFVYLRSHDYNIDSTLASGTYSGSKLLAKNMPDGIYITQRTLTVHDSQYNKLSINRSDLSNYSLVPIKFGESSDYCPDFKEDSYRGNIEIPENTSTSTVITTFKDEIKDPYGNFVSPEFSLGGLDGHIFNISEDGDITFKAVPDYENHLDSDNNSQYKVDVRVHSTAYPVSENPNLYISEGITIEVTNVKEWPSSAQVDFINDTYSYGWVDYIPGNFQVVPIISITEDIPYTKVIISGQDADYFQFPNGTKEGTGTNDLNFIIYRSDKSYECGRSFTFRITLTDGINSVYDDAIIPLTCS